MMAALNSIIGGLPLLTARTIIAAFLLIRAALLAPLVVLLILLAGILGSDLPFEDPLSRRSGTLSKPATSCGRCRCRLLPTYQPDS
jgi:hypothetical protein